jgi:GMP synthase-like glutamine amidotransferase
MLLDEQTRVRVIGVCFGHQVIARALGVMPTRSHKGWEVAVTPVQLTDKGKQIFGLESLVSIAVISPGNGDGSGYKSYIRLLNAP